MRGKDRSTELDSLARGLGGAEDPYRIKALLRQSVEDLANHLENRIRYTAVDMIDQGRYFMAIKEKCGHGNWEAFVAGRKWSWNYVRGCMKFLEVVAEFPQAIHLPPGRVTDRLLQLPPPQIDDVLRDLPPEGVKRLTPWHIEKAHHDKTLEDAKSRRRKPKPPKEIPEVTDLDALVTDALSALMKISEYTISDREAPRAARYLHEIEKAWNRAAYNLKDPEHKTKPWWETLPTAESEFGEEAADA